MRRRIARWADLVLGERCQVTGRDRVFPKDRRQHERDEHATDGPCA